MTIILQACHKMQKQDLLRHAQLDDIALRPRSKKMKKKKLQFSNEKEENDTDIQEEKNRKKKAGKRIKRKT